MSTYDTVIIQPEPLQSGKSVINHYSPNLSKKRNLRVNIREKTLESNLNCSLLIRPLIRISLSGEITNPFL